MSVWPWVASGMGKLHLTAYRKSLVAQPLDLYKGVSLLKSGVVYLISFCQKSLRSGRTSPLIQNAIGSILIVPPTTPTITDAKLLKQCSNLSYQIGLKSYLISKIVVTGVMTILRTLVITASAGTDVSSNTNNETQKCYYLMWACHYYYLYATMLMFPCLLIKQTNFVSVL